MKPRNVQGEFSAVRARRARGFSLIELMIVIVIVGVLSAIAWPSYQQYVQRSNRAAAQSFMMTIAQRQEQYILTNRSYASTIAALNLTQPPETNGRYSFDFESTTASTYVVRATPQGTQSVPGKFDVLTLSSTGAKLPTEEWRK
jgi:type IV pilus assembly protein PilE